MKQIDSKARYSHPINKFTRKMHFGKNQKKIYRSYNRKWRQVIEHGSSSPSCKDLNKSHSDIQQTKKRINT